MTGQQNDISALYFKKPNLQNKIEPILASIVRQSGFHVDKLLQQSAWWVSTAIGAMHYAGTFQDQPAILKIQGVKPNFSEADNILAFTRQNKSSLIRPPKVYWSAPWNDKLKFEALIYESLEQEKLVGLPATQAQINEFFSVYQDYRLNCLKQPWLDQPSISLADGVARAFAQWSSIRQELFPRHPLIEPGDEELIERAVKTLTKEYQAVEWQWQHGHFSARDIFPKDEQYILLSNLYWSWRLPYYDAVFGFHWYQFDLAVKPETAIEQLGHHRQWWNEAIQATISPQTPQEKRLLELAFLERAAAGLNLDGLLNPTPVSRWLIQTLRQEIQVFTH